MASYLSRRTLSRTLERLSCRDVSIGRCFARLAGRLRRKDCEIPVLCRFSWSGIKQEGSEACCFPTLRRIQLDMDLRREEETAGVSAEDWLLSRNWVDWQVCKLSGLHW